MDDVIRRRIEAATVRVNVGESGHGQAVLVPGGFLLTAAHCIDCDDASVTLGDHVYQTIETKSHGTIYVAPVVIERANDIGAFSSLDDQAAPEDADEFEAFCEATEPVPVASDSLDVRVDFPVFVLSHEGHWIDGTARLCREGSAILFVTPKRTIPLGTSGGPIVNEAGELVALVSTGKMGDPRPCLALPVWATKAIEAAASQAAMDD
jgi:hypothetical protein